MRLYRVQYTERQIITRTIPADDPDAAVRLAGCSPRRVLSVEPVDMVPDPELGFSCARLLLRHRYISIEDREQATLADWVRHAASAVESGDLAAANAMNRQLAPAGLRVKPNPNAPTALVWVANRGPFLDAVFAKTRFAAGKWGPALQQVPGAEKACLTFSGLAARATGLQAGLMLHGGPVQ